LLTILENQAVSAKLAEKEMLGSTEEEDVTDRLKRINKSLFGE
jgi:hypothetical protein